MPAKDYNAYMRQYMGCRYLKRKFEAIEYKGGRCVVCGYNQCHAAMVFHHRDPNEKELDWKYLRKRSWEFIKRELDKCDLLCHNCHAEEHYDPETTTKALEWLAARKQQKPTFDRNGKCLRCGEPFIRTKQNRTKKFCSHACSSKAREVADWPSNRALITLVEKKGQVEVGKQLGVSPRTIKKRIDRIIADSLISLP
jgi:hypothetical protein